MLCVKTIYRDTVTGVDKESCGFFCEPHQLAEYLRPMGANVSINVYEAQTRIDGTYPNTYKKGHGFQGITLGQPLDLSTF